MTRNPTGYRGPPEQEVTLLPAQGDILFGVPNQNPGEYDLLKYSRWSFQKIQMSKESGRRARSGLYFSLVLDGHQSIWQQLYVEVPQDDGLVRIVRENPFFTRLYENQGSVTKTLGLVGSPLKLRRSSGWGWFRGAIVVLLVTTMIGFLLNLAAINGENHRLVKEAQFELRQHQREVARQRSRVAGHPNRITAIRGRLKTLLARIAEVKEQSDEALSHLRTGISTVDKFRGYQTLLFGLRSQRWEEEERVVVLTQELQHLDQLLKESKQLQQRLDTLEKRRLLDRLRDQFESHLPR